MITRKDNLGVFITQDGEACDKGAKALAEAGLLPKIANVMLTRARPISYENKNIILIVIKNKVSKIIEKQILNKAVHSLLDVLRKLNLQMLSICESNIKQRPVGKRT